MSQQLTIAELIAILERADQIWQALPDLMQGFAVGLTVCDHNEAIRLGRILVPHTPLREGTGGIDAATYEASRQRYIHVYDTLSDRGIYLNPNDHEALRATIAKLRTLSAG